MHNSRSETGNTPAKVVGVLPTGFSASPEFAALDWLQATMQQMPEQQQLAYTLRRIGAVIQGSVLLFNRLGDLVEGVGKAPAQLLWDAHHGRREATVGRWHSIAVPCGPTELNHTLIVAHRTSDAHPVPADFFSAADLAITACLNTIRGIDARRSNERASVLADLTNGIATSRTSRYWHRLAEFDFAPRTPVVIVVGVLAEHRVTSPAQIRALLGRAHDAGVPLLFATRMMSAASDGEFHALLPAAASAINWFQHAAPLSSLGVSDSHTDLTDIPRALREAELAQRVAAEFSGPATRLERFRDLSIRHWLTASAPPTELQVRRQRILRSFDSQPELQETLVRYLANDLDVTATARDLYLHPNTVRYRLTKIEQRLGGSLRSPRVLTDVMLCLEPLVVAATEPSE